MQGTGRGAKDVNFAVCAHREERRYDAAPSPPTHTKNKNNGDSLETAGARAQSYRFLDYEMCQLINFNVV